MTGLLVCIIKGGRDRRTPPTAQDREGSFFGYSLGGGIASDNETLYMEDENSYFDGKLISANEMELACRQIGPGGMRIALAKYTWA